MPQVVQTRVMSRFLAINDCIVLLSMSSSVLFSHHSIDPHARFIMAFFIFRVMFYVASSITGMMRKTSNFYIPAVSEMDDEIYWSMVLMVMFAMKYTFVDRFVQTPPFITFIGLSMATYFIVSLLMRFQSQYWAVEKRKEREERIAQLTSKVRLSTSELYALKPFFIARIEKTQIIPFRWRVIGVLVSVVIGAIISTYVDGLFDWIGNIP